MRFDKQAEFMLWLSGWTFAADSHELETLPGKRSERPGQRPWKNFEVIEIEKENLRHLSKRMTSTSLFSTERRAI